MPFWLWYLAGLFTIPAVLAAVSFSDGLLHAIGDVYAHLRYSIRSGRVREIRWHFVPIWFGVVMCQRMFTRRRSFPFKPFDNGDMWIPPFGYECGKAQ